MKTKTTIAAICLTLAPFAFSEEKGHEGHDHTDHAEATHKDVEQMDGPQQRPHPHHHGASLGNLHHRRAQDPSHLPRQRQQGDHPHRSGRLRHRRRPFRSHPHDLRHQGRFTHFRQIPARWEYDPTHSPDQNRSRCRQRHRALQCGLLGMSDLRSHRIRLRLRT